MHRRRCLQGSLIPALLALPLLLAACGEETEDPGVLSLAWRVSPLGCAESGVQDVEIAIIGLDDQGDALGTSPCTAGRAIFDGLAPGQYNVTLTGRDAKGQATFQSSSSAVAVKPGQVLDHAMRLTARPGSVSVTWFFKNGHLCASNGVQQIFVGAYDADAYVLQESMFDCAVGTGTLQGLPSGRFFIEVLGIAPDMSSTFRGIEAIELSRGDDMSLDVPLNACDGDCQP